MARVAANRLSAEDRFWPKIEVGDACWVWLGHVGQNGYGQFRYDGRTQQAHRFAYEWFNGPIPEGHVIDHLCRTKACVKPDHLEAVTQRENIMRGDVTVEKPKCCRGHVFPPREPGAKQRFCRECQRLRDKKRRSPPTG